MTPLPRGGFKLIITLTLVFITTGCTRSDKSLNAEILGANGLFFDAHDQLYVASVIGAGIWIIDRESGETKKILRKQQGVLSPDDVTIGPGGVVYFTNTLQGTVGSLSQEGEVSEIANLGIGVNSLTLADDGQLWVGRDFIGDRLYQLDPAGKEEPRTIITEPGWINAMDFGPDGMLYGPVYSKSIVVRINPLNGVMTTVADDFETRLHAVKFDHAGRLYVLEGRPGRVLRIDLESGERTVLGSYAPGLDNLAFDSNDRLFVSSFLDGSIHEVMKDFSLRVVKGPSDKAVIFTLGFFVGIPVFFVLVLVAMALYFRRVYLRYRMAS